MVNARQESERLISAAKREAGLLVDRMAIVERAKERRRDYTVDWVHLKLNDQSQRTLMLKDPFVSHDDRVERLIESL